MNDLLERADPAAGREVDTAHLRALVEERIGLTTVAKPVKRLSGRGWMVAVASFALVLAIAVPTLLSRTTPSSGRLVGDVPDLPGIEAVIPLASGGVQTMAVLGDDIWVVTAFQNVVQRVSMGTNRIVASYPIDGHVEGVVSGDGYLWMLSYDNGGEILRFDPESGVVDLSVPLGGLPNFAQWFGGRLFANNDHGEYVEISPDGTVLSRASGTVLGVGLDLLWVFDPDDGSIRSMSADGAPGQYVLPGSTPEFGDLSEVRSLQEAGGYMWLIFGSTGESVGRFDPVTGGRQPLHVGRWLHSTTERDGHLWVTSYSDDLLFEVDPESGEIRTFALPGRPGGLVLVGEDLWVLLYQPGSLIRIDPSADLLEMGEEVAATTADASSPNPHTLVCTLGGVDEETVRRAQVDRDFTGLGPTIVLEGPSWIGIGIWSVVQAEIEGHVVCASGGDYTGGGGTPQQRAAALADSLQAASIPGPYQLVAAGDGVHTIRLFAAGRDDISGVVLVEPIPIGFQTFYDGLLGEEFTHPNWLDLEPQVSDALTDFGGLPLAILSHDPSAVFLADRFIDSAGVGRAESLSDYWEDGMDFYAGLSADSRRVSASQTGFDGVLWFRPQMVADEITSMGGSRG